MADVTLTNPNNFVTSSQLNDVVQDFAGKNDLRFVKKTDSASTTAAGIVQLSSATDSESEALAATPKAVKAAYDLASTAKNTADTLVGSDTGKSARAIAAEELAKQLIPDEAKESLDTLEEIAAWIQSHPDDAATMSADITALKTKTTLGNDGEGKEYATVKAYVEAYVASQVSAATEAATAADIAAIKAGIYAE